MVLLLYRNTSDLGWSPAQILVARMLWDAVPVRQEDYMPRNEWVLTTKAREMALIKRYLNRQQDLTLKTKVLLQLALWTVLIITQNKLMEIKLEFN